MIARLYQSEQRQIIALRAARGEYNFRLAAVDQSGHTLTSLLDCRPRLLAVLMDRRRVAEIFEQPGTHRLQHLGKQRRCGIRVHVDAAHTSILRGFSEGSLSLTITREVLC